jgi:hypothetical protein
LPVEDKSVGEDIEDKENKEVPTDNKVCDINFVNETFGAGCGQLQQVHYTFIIYFIPFLHLSILYSPLQIGRSAELLASFPGSDMNNVIMRFWLKRRENLIHPYLLVGYLLSSNCQ